jgi:hypothetical protein
MFLFWMSVSGQAESLNPNHLRRLRVTCEHIAKVGDTGHEPEQL